MLLNLDYYFYLLFLSVLDIVVTLFHMTSMCAVVSFVRPILETVVAHCTLPPPSYLCEIGGDGHVLAGVEIEIPGDGVSLMPQRFFFEPLGVRVLQMHMSRLLCKQSDFYRGYTAL